MDRENIWIRGHAGAASDARFRGSLGGADLDVFGEVLRVCF